MSRFILATALLLAASISQSSAQAVDLFFSEYVEGSGNVKYLEIFNGTGATVDLTDYEVLLFSNGSTTASDNSLTSISGTLASGSVLVIANSSAEVVYPGDKIVSNVTYFNGDDALAIRKKSTGNYVDIFGRIGEDPGSEWTSGSLTTVNKTLRRLSNITSGVTTNPGAGFPTLASEWEMFNTDDISDLGKHTFDAVQHLGETLFLADETFQYAQTVPVLDYTSAQTTLAQGLEVLRFYANEGGVNLNDEDELPTHFTQLQLNVTGAENIAELGVYLDNQLIGSTTSVTNTVDIQLSNADLADNNQGIFSFKVVLKNIVEDHAQIFVDVVRVVVSDQGSGFIEQTGSYTYESEKASGYNFLEVDATEIEVTSSLTTVSANTAFNIVVKAQNGLGSVDIDTESQLSLDVRSGSESLTFLNGSSSNSVFSNGIVSWSVSYPAIEEIILLVSSTFGDVELTIDVIENSVGDIYETIAPGLTGAELIQYLRDNYKVTNSLGYDTGRDRMFMDIDNQKVNGQDASVNTLECVYTGRLVTGYNSRSSAQGSNFNTEHTWPQSKFGSANPMVSDIHHLFPTDGTANGARGNLPFSELSASEVDKWYKGTDILTSAPSVETQGQYSQLKTNTSFEPRDVHKGNVARAMFYFWTMYANNSNMTSDNASFFSGMKNDLLKWHRFDISDEVEIKRSNDVKIYQGNRNPFVHDTSLVARAYFPETIVSNEKELTTAPSGFVLHQNYPNPFNPSTKISYELSNTGLVRLTVYDVLGKEVAVLVNANQSIGQHTVQFNASQFASGIYFIKLDFNNQTQIKTMSLIK